MIGDFFGWISSDEVVRWILYGILIVSTIATAYTVGRPRKPISEGDFLFICLVNVLLALAIYSL